MRSMKRRLAKLEHTAGAGKLRYVFAWGDAPVATNEGERVLVVRFVWKEGIHETAQQTT